jgi:asparagine synthase (glutamine-hydrolysing)
LSKLNADLTAYTVGVRGDSSDEAAEAAKTARILGIQHEVVELPFAGPEALDELENAYSEPFASQSALAMLRVSRAVKSEATVVLTGDGGDDVFLGYPFLHSAWVAQQTAQRIPGAAAGMIRTGASLLPRLGVLGRARNLLRYSTSGLSAYVDASNSMRYYASWSILGERLREIVLPYRSLPPSMESARNLLADVLKQQHRFHFVGQFMEKVDGATMYHSLEARSPFLDGELWEFAASLPPSLHFRGGVLKAILREIVRRRVNPEIAARPKRGFTVPVERWLAGRWTRSLDVLAVPNELERQGWIRPGSLQAPVAQAREKNWVPFQLWSLMLLERWLVRQNARDSKPRAA